jgi:uncharacterized protein (DUF697 family)
MQSDDPRQKTNDARKGNRALVSLVLVEAVGSSMTPFVPLPFVDDYLLARLLRRIARKVLERAGQPSDELVTKAIVEGYVHAGDTGLGEKAVTAAARFVVRKVAVVLDVKKSHDVFGEVIAFALALDVAAELGGVHPTTSLALGGAIFRSTQSVGSAALEVLTRAGREAFQATSTAPESSRFGRVAEAMQRQVDETRIHLDRAMRDELTRIGSPG